MFERELDFYEKHQVELCKKYRDKYVAIRGDEILGVYDEFVKGYFEAAKKYKPGTFMLHVVSDDPDMNTIRLSPYVA